MLLENVSPATALQSDAIDKIHASGGTNISAGLELGKKLVDSHNKPDYSKRLFLFSDGLANGGIQDAQGLGKLAAEFLKDEVRTNTFGIGSDFDESIMKVCKL
jgi:Ca-activated chloride channel family protein